LIATASLTNMQSYIDAVTSGEIVACKFVKDAVARHVKDLGRQSTQDFPYHFSEKHAAAAIDFFPLMLNHSIGDYVGQPFHMEPWQAWITGCMFGWKRDCDGARRFRQAYVSVGRKNGKAQALDSVLPTPTGTTTMGEVEEGDYLIGRDGEPVRVLATSEIWEDRPVYQVEFSDGEVVECDGNHEWTYLKKRKKGGRGEKPRIWFSEETVETKWLAKQSLTDSKGAKFRIPNAVVQGQHKELPINPYTLGAWLGDGESNGQRIVCHRDDLGSLLDNIDDFETRMVSSGGKGPEVRSVSMLGWKPAARSLSVLGNKHIPEIYFTASVEQRIELLQGLMDTDGSISKAGQCEFTQKKGRLATDVKRLLASLGIYAKCKTSDMKLNGKIVGERQRIMFFPPSNVMPFRLPRKAKRVRKKKKDGTRKIVRVEYVRQDRTKCVEVEGGLYMTGNYVLTHNSTWAAGIAIRFAALDINPSTQGIESVAEVILSATKREQAQVIYKEIERMRHRSPHIEQVSKTINKQITFTHNSGSIRTVGSDKSYDGLNPSLCVMDELHAWSPNRHQKFYDTMVTGSGSRLQPMKLVVTTAGDDKSLIWIEEYKHAKSVAAGDVRDDSLFAVHYEIDEGDDPLDESCWVKANPNLHVSLKLDYLRQQAIPAKTSKIALNRFTRYHGNRLVSSVESAFDIEKWDKCAGELSDWQYAEATGGGCDLGGRNDLAAWAVVARFPVEGTENDETPTYRYEIRSQSYISDETSRDLTRQPFCEWIHNDLLKKSPYPVSDLSEDFISACREYWVRDIAFDPAQAQQLSECLRRAGVPNAPFPQTTSYYHEPLSEFRQAIEEGRVTHDGNRLLRWCIGNAMAVQDRQDHWMLTKRDSSDKIDPVVAVIMALWRAMVAPGRYAGKNLYF